MANICCDDVIFYTEGNPEGLYDLWEDLETHIILNQNPDLCWIGNLFSHKKIDSTGISLRGNVSYMEWNGMIRIFCCPYQLPGHRFTNHIRQSLQHIIFPL